MRPRRVIISSVIGGLSGSGLVVATRPYPAIADDHPSATPPPGTRPSRPSRPRQHNTDAEKAALREGRIPDAWAAKPKKLAQKDRDARWTLKRAKARPAKADGTKAKVEIAIPVFGYKTHVSIDRKHGFVRRFTVTSAAAHDGTQLANVLDAASTASEVSRRYRLPLEDQRGSAGQAWPALEDPLPATARPRPDAGAARGQPRPLQGPLGGRDGICRPQAPLWPVRAHHRPGSSPDQDWAHQPRLQPQALPLARSPAGGGPRDGRGGPYAPSPPLPDCQNASPRTPKLRAGSIRRSNPAIARFFEVSEQVGLEARALGLVAVDIRQAADAVTLHAETQRQAGQMRQARLQRLKAVVARQQGVPLEGDDDRLVLQAEHAGAGLLQPIPRIRAGLARAPLLHRRGANTIALGRSPHAYLTSLHCSTDRRSRRGAAVENLSHSASLHAASVVKPHSGTKNLAEHL